MIEGGHRGLQNSKSRDILRFLPCLVRFLELCCSRDMGDRTGYSHRSRGAGRYNWSWHLPVQVNY